MEEVFVKKLGQGVRQLRRSKQKKAIEKDCLKDNKIQVQEDTQTEKYYLHDKEFCLVRNCKHQRNTQMSSMLSAGC